MRDATLRGAVCQRLTWPGPGSGHAQARRTGERYQQARAHHGLARACDATGQHGSGREHWQRALDIYTSLGVPEAARTAKAP